MRLLLKEKYVDGRAPLVQHGVDELGDDVLLVRVVLPGIGPRGEEVLDAGQVGQAARGQRLPDLREGGVEVLGEGRAAQERHQVLAEVQRAELGQGEGLGQPLLVSLDQPPDLAAVRALVEEREPGLLQGLDVAADGALGDAVLVGQVLRGRVAPGLDPLEDPPLTNDLGVTHSSDPLRSGKAGKDERALTSTSSRWKRNPCPSSIPSFFKPAAPLPSLSLPRSRAP